MVKQSNKQRSNFLGHGLSVPIAFSLVDHKPLTTTLGIIFSSPMFLLKEGQRNITLNMVFEKESDVQFLENATFYLSTQLAWLPVPVKILMDESTRTATILINLDATQPCIECFANSPAEVSNASWPMLKIAFNLFLNGLKCEAPVITSIEIKVDVSNIKTLQLYNDFGLLNTEGPYQPFGPKPMLNSSFIIGSNEIFSKPLSSCIVELDWDNLPNDFSDYYQQYNDFLNKKINRKSTAPVSNNLLASPINSFDADPVTMLVEKPINNKSFTANTYILQNKVWKAFDMPKQNACAIQSDNTFTCVPYKTVADKADPLFTTNDDNKSPSLIGASFYAYQQSFDSKAALVCDPTIQNTVLKFSETSGNGFMKITLSGPVFGFGSGIYLNVIYNTVLANGKILDLNETQNAFKAQPNLPFAPNLKNVTAHYSASKTYIFNNTIETYPLQVFLYSSSENKTVFDSAKLIADIDYRTDQSVHGSANRLYGVAYYFDIIKKFYQ